MPTPTLPYELNPKPPETAAAPTPSAALTKAATTIIRLTDSTGRSLGLRRPGVVEQLRMLEMVGGVNSANDAYMGIVTLAFHCAEIDGEAVSLPASKREIEARIKQLDQHGIEAVALGCKVHFMPADDQTESARDRLKNLSGTPS